MINNNATINLTQPLKLFNMKKITLFFSNVLLAALSLSSFNSKGQCPIDPNVYLTNIAFTDDANAGLSGFDLPLTMSFNSNNPNNFLDVGTPVRFKIKCFNNKSNGSSIVSGLCKIRTTDPNIQLIDSTAGLNNVGYNTEAWSTDEFEITVSNTITTSYTAFVDFVVIEGTTQYTTKCIPIPIKPYTLASLTIDDDNNPDSHGNSNGVANPLEAVEILPYINNTSTFDADFMYGMVLDYNVWSGILVWDNLPGISGTVYSAGWWNYSFGAPNTIPAGSVNMLPEYDFVFDYNYASTYNLDLLLATYSGFKIFGSSNNSALVATTVKLPINSGFTDIPLVPSVTTTTATSSITSTSATSGGNVTSVGESAVTQRGVCYSPTANPTTTDPKVVSGTGSGVFTSTITGLTPNTLYHVRAFATNIHGTSYGNDISFTTLTNTIGIEEVSIYNIVNIYPNPFNNEFVIKSDIILMNEKYRIRNIIGECVAKGLINNEIMKVDLENLPNGLYFLTIDGISKQAIKISKN